MGDRESKRVYTKQREQKSSFLLNYDYGDKTFGGLLQRRTKQNNTNSKKKKVTSAKEQT